MTAPSMKDCLETLALGSTIGGPATLAHLEKQGQKQEARRSTLPSDMGGSRLIFEKMGVVFHGPVPGDDLFLEVTLPPGWRKDYTEHSMGLVLLDDRGRQRATIFYKAASYDRRAYMNPCRRYNASGNYGDANHDDIARGVVYDQKTEIWSTERVRLTKENRYGNRSNNYKGIRDLLTDQARAWLDENRPQWMDPLAYWGE